MEEHRADSALVLERALELRDRGQVSAMAEVLTAHLADNPDDARAWAALAGAHALKREDEQAERAVARAVALAPTDAFVQANHARVLLRLRRAEEAMETAERALSADSGMMDAKLVAASARWALGDAAGALRLAEALLADQPGAAGAHALRAAVLQQLHRTGEAVAAAQEAVRFGYAHPEAWRLLQGLGLTQEAIAALRRRLDGEPADAAAMGAMGDLLRNQGDLDEAQSWLARAVEADPSHAPHWLAYAVVLQQLGRTAEAIAAYERLSLLDPQPAVSANLADLHISRGALAAAMDPLRLACRLEPRSAAHRLRLGDCALRIGADDEAETAFREARALEPDNLTALRRTGDIDAAAAGYAARAAAGRLDVEDLEDWLQLLLSRPGAGAVVETWRTFEPRLDLAARERTRLASYAMVALWLHGRAEEVAALAAAHAASATGASGRETNAFAYLRYVASLAQFRLAHPALYGGGQEARPVAVIGDSHALALAGLLTPSWGGSPARFSAGLIVGIQMAHLARPHPNASQAYFDKHIAALPDGAELLLTVGEIDCRPEGIWRTARIQGRPPAEVAEAVVDGYFERLCRGALARFRQLTLQGVPAPAYAFAGRLTPGDSPGDFLALVRHVDSLIKARALDAGWRFLDVHTLTAADGAPWRIDDTHLSPAFYVEADRL